MSIVTCLYRLVRNCHFVGCHELDISTKLRRELHVDIIQVDKKIRQFNKKIRKVDKRSDKSTKDLTSQQKI